MLNAGKTHALHCSRARSSGGVHKQFDRNTKTPKHLISMERFSQTGH